MSLDLSLAYKISAAQAQTATTGVRLRVHGRKYVFEVGQGPLAHALTTEREPIERELEIVLGDFARGRGAHAPGPLVAAIATLREAASIADSLPARIAALYGERGRTMLLAELGDFETFCAFGVAHGLAFAATLA